MEFTGSQEDSLDFEKLQHYNSTQPFIMESESSSYASSTTSSTQSVAIRKHPQGKQERMLSDHLSLLTLSSGHPERQNQEVATTPIFTVADLSLAAKHHLLDGPKSPLAQHGLLAGLSDVLENEQLSESGDRHFLKDPRVFFNTTTPSSTFICGSQGSGKSHTLSCLLENCLIPSIASKLPKPLNAMVFHYDTFISDDSGSPCEAAFLASKHNIKVRVLCSPTNRRTIERTYSHFRNVVVEPLLIRQSDLNTKRMLDLMAVKTDDGPLPLYLHTVYRVLRDMRMVQQEDGSTFDYAQFKTRILSSGLTPHQQAPLDQRLDTLESFMPSSETGNLPLNGLGRRKKGMALPKGTDWSSEAGLLTIVDLSCPCVTPEGACALFNICLSLFIEQYPEVGRVIALDEAHKFMNASTEADTLTNTLLSTIRLQRHLGVRIIISTQEPTISPKLLDLCSVTIVHRFTSPDWMRSLQQHLAGAASSIQTEADDPDTSFDFVKNGAANDIFRRVVALKVGQALLFSPSAIVGWDMEPNGRNINSVHRLGAGFLNVQIRSRITDDGGKSVMAS